MSEAIHKVIKKKCTHSPTSQGLLIDLCYPPINRNFLAIASDEGVRSVGKGERPPLTKSIVKLNLTPVGIRSARRERKKKGEEGLPCRPNQIGNAQSSRSELLEWTAARRAINNYDAVPGPASTPCDLDSDRLVSSKL